MNRIVTNSVSGDLIDDDDHTAVCTGTDEETRRAVIMNQTPATAVTGAGATWTFTFDQPPTGEVLISFSAAHNISDVATPAHPFDHLAPAAAWRYDYVDVAPPVVAQINPPAGATVRNLTQVEIVFNEPVIGLEAADLLIEGVAAGAMTNPAVNKYVFAFPARPSGATHGSKFIITTRPCPCRCVTSGCRRA